MTNRRTKFKNYVDEEGKRKNKAKSRVRAKMEHPFRILKRIIGFTMVRYRGLKKNHEWLCAAFALVNLYQHRNRLAPQAALCLWRPGNGLQRSSKQAENALFKPLLIQNNETLPCSLRRCKIRYLRRGSLRQMACSASCSKAQATQKYRCATYI
jgi:hypothetical protein